MNRKIKIPAIQAERLIELSERMKFSRNIIVRIAVAIYINSDIKPEYESIKSTKLEIDRELIDGSKKELIEALIKNEYLYDYENIEFINFYNFIIIKSIDYLYSEYSILANNDAFYEYILKLGE